MKSFNESEVIAMLKANQGKRTQAEFAEHIGITAQYLGDVYRGRRAPGPTILDYLGLEKTYRKAEKQ
jgi:transcriptional regulator with XRE-family HTH domain